MLYLQRRGDIMIKLAVDAMGGDLGSSIVVKAVLDYLKEHNDVEFHVVGKLEELKELEGKATLYHANDVMGMEDGALTILRKKETSMNKAVELVANGVCDGVVSCGSTGAFLTLSTLKVKLIPGVKRAALGTLFPTLDPKKLVLMLDLGASNENNGEQIAQFAEMGEEIYRKLYNKENVNVYLLSNGSEDKKGCPEGKEAFKILKEKNYSWFKGNMESKFVLQGEADVIATGGYAGNVLLKSIEGTASLMAKLMKKAFKKNIFTMIGYLFAKSGVKAMRKHIDPSRGGGAMLIGINNVCVKAHGNSDAIGFKTGIEFAVSMIKENVCGILKDKYAQQ